MKYVKTLMILTFILLLSGCWDRIELEERAYVVVIGIDDSDIENGIYVTFQIGNPQVGSSDISNAQNEPASDIVTLLAPDVSSARELANISVSRSITFSHTKAIIISESLAKSDKFLRLIEYIVRDRELRREVELIICKENASDFIRNINPQMETRPHKFYELMTKRWESTGLVPFTTFQRYLNRTISDESIFLATYATTIKDTNSKYGYEDNYIAGQVDKYNKNPVQMIGSAVLKEGKMIGTLTGEQTRGSLLLRPKIRTTSFLATFKDPINPDYLISARVLKMKKNKYDMDLSKKPPEINVTVPIDIEILGIPSFINYVTDIKKQKLLENHIEKSLEEKTKKLVMITQTDFKAEPFQWANVAKRHFTSIKEYQDFDWMKSYPQSIVNVKFEVNIVDFGRQLQPFNENQIVD